MRVEPRIIRHPYPFNSVGWLAQQGYLRVNRTSFADSTRRTTPRKRPSLRRFFSIRAYRDSYNRVNLDIWIRPFSFDFRIVNEPWDGPTARLFMELPGGRFLLFEFAWKLRS